MNSADKPSEMNKSGNFVPALCCTIGTLIIILVIIVAAAFTIPRLFGFEIYNVISSSMEPAVPLGSAVFVKGADPEELEPGDIVAFLDEGGTITHRLVENHRIAREIITKGDANEIVDFEPVPYSAVLGRVKFIVPVIGNYMMAISGTVGKLYLVLLAACGVMFNSLGTLIRKNRKLREDKARHNVKD